MTRVAIIGGGLAGTACAYVLKHYGATPVIYEAGAALATGASGNQTGLYNPRLSAERSAESDYFTAGFAMAVRAFGELPGIDFTRCGALHLITDEKREKRFAQCIKNWGWDSEHMRLVDRRQASGIAGVELDHAALYLPDSGTVSPKKLCERYAEGAEIHLNARVEDLSALDADIIIIANALAAQQFSGVAFLPLKPVRGQVTQVRATPQSEKLRCNLCYGRYMSPARSGVHMLGATFQRWLDHSDIIDEDDADNIAKLAEVTPGLAAGLEIAGQRAAVRTTTPDFFPVAGRVPGRENLYVSTAHGSHGIISSLASAHLIGTMIAGHALPLPRATVEKLSPARFMDTDKSA
jgi:tRNA 5-methylaminomethyl-2-thiouridine biosynthesis bifunctional protein